MDFGDALRALKAGRRVLRTNWNGKGMYLLCVTRCEMRSKDEDGYETAASSPGGVPPFLAMKTAQNALVPWVASQADMLAEDWRTADD